MLGEKGREKTEVILERKMFRQTEKKKKKKGKVGYIVTGMK